MSLDQNRLCVELQRLDWARQLEEPVIHEIAASAELMEYLPGQVVIPLDSEINHVYFIVTGRLEGALVDRIGKQVHHEVFGRGSVVGLFSVLLPDRSHLQVEALEPTTVVRLTLDQLLRLTSAHREFQLTMFRTAANIVKRLVIVDRDFPKPAVVGVVHQSSASRSLTVHLARRLPTSRSLNSNGCSLSSTRNCLRQITFRRKGPIEQAIQTYGELPKLDRPAMNLGPEEFSRRLGDPMSFNCSGRHA